MESCHYKHVRTESTSLLKKKLGEPWVHVVNHVSKWAELAIYSFRNISGEVCLNFFILRQRWKAMLAAISHSVSRSVETIHYEVLLGQATGHI